MYPSTTESDVSGKVFRQRIRSVPQLTEYEQGKAFPACRHCSCILAKSKGINIPTGRVDN